LAQLLMREAVLPGGPSATNGLGPSNTSHLEKGKPQGCEALLAPWIGSATPRRGRLLAC
jgi:hypothetical protein